MPLEMGDADMDTVDGEIFESRSLVTAVSEVAAEDWSTKNIIVTMPAGPGDSIVFAASSEGFLPLEAFETR